MIPDVPVDEIDAAQASAPYLAATKSEGRFWADQGATHHGYLKVVKELWRWLLDREFIEKDAFAKVKPIGKGERGQAAARAARGEDAGATLRSCEAGEEGALAILVQLYLGLRPSEVLGLTVGAVDGINVFVNGTKNQNAKRRLELLRPSQNFLRNTARSDPSASGFSQRQRQATFSQLDVQAAAFLLR